GRGEGGGGGGGWGGAGDADRGAGSGNVFDHHGLTEGGLHGLGQDATQRVERAAGRERHDDGHRLGRKRLRSRRGRPDDRGKGRNLQQSSPSHRSLQAALRLILHE